MEEKTEKKMIEGLGQGYYPACEPKQAKYLYRIGMFAAMNHVTIKALRFYEEQKLLRPAYVDAENGYRYYTMTQMADLQQILALKEAGFTLEDIKQIRRQKDGSRYLLRKKNEILEEISALMAKLSSIETLIQGGSSVLEMPIRIRRIPAVVTAMMQITIEAYDALFEMMPRMGAEMERLGCICAVPEYCFTNYIEPGHQEKDIRVEICEAVTRRGEDSDSLKFKEFPEVEAACTYHKGAYRDLATSYEKILRYIEENGYEICGNIRESYIDGVWNQDDEKDWLTEIQIPVRKREA